MEAFIRPAEDLKHMFYETLDRSNLKTGSRRMKDCQQEPLTSLK